MSERYPDVCMCGHAREEHGGDPKYPGSLKCTGEGCACVHFDEDPDAGMDDPE